MISQVIGNNALKYIYSYHKIRNNTVLTLYKMTIRLRISLSIMVQKALLKSKAVLKNYKRAYMFLIGT